MRRREFITLLGGAAAWPRNGVAQVSTRRPLVAVLHGQSLATASHYEYALAQRMQELGYVAGRDIDIVWRYADGDVTRGPALADEVVRLKPDARYLAREAARTCGRDRWWHGKNRDADRCRLPGARDPS
jgi:putative tryptophan/tyrosine transport system substrate-binding protein